MEVRIQEGGTKIQLLYVLWVLENFSDENNVLKQEDIVEILRKKGYRAERKSVARDLKLLLDFGYKIHGIEPELDKDGNELPLKRGKIWLEREFTDDQLSLLLNSATYNVFVDKDKKEKLLDNIISLGSATFKANHSAKTILNGGRIYQVEGATLLNQLRVIESAIDQEKKLRFKYGKLKRDANKFVYEQSKEYVVSPYWIVVQKGNTYLVCYNHVEDKIWNFRVDKMKDVEVIKSYALPRSETKLKGVDVGEYVGRHPLMFTDEAINIKLKVNKNYVGHVLDTFGEVSPLSEDEDNIILGIYAGEIDAFYWAVQFGGFVEVLNPQNLRDKIRHHIEGMVFNYQRGDGKK